MIFFKINQQTKNFKKMIWELFKNEYNKFNFSKKAQIQH